MKLKERLLKLVGMEIFPRVTLETAWRNIGKPPRGLSWEDGKNYNWTAWKPPEICPNCRGKASVILSDWWDIENSGQYMVRIHFCPNGCGYSVWLA